MTDNTKHTYRCGVCGEVSIGTPDCCNYGTQNPEIVNSRSQSAPLCPLTPKELRRFAELSELRPGVCPELRALGIQLAEGKKDSDYFDLAIITSRLLASALDRVAELEAQLPFLEGRDAKRCASGNDAWRVALDEIDAFERGEGGGR